MSEAVPADGVSDPIDPKTARDDKLKARQAELDAIQKELDGIKSDDNLPAPDKLTDLTAAKAVVPDAVQRRIAADDVAENYAQLDRFVAFRKSNINTAWAAAKAGETVDLATIADDAAAFLEGA